MPFQSKKPPISITLSIDEYNKVLEYISGFESSEYNVLREKSIALKDKLLKYSVPKVIDENELVNVRFFINEVSDILEIFLKNVDIEPKTDFYTVLLKVRDKNYVRK